MAQLASYLVADEDRRRRLATLVEGAMGKPVAWVSEDAVYEDIRG
jgi:hypothetical protein